MSKQMSTEHMNFDKRLSMAGICLVIFSRSPPCKNVNMLFSRKESPVASKLSLVVQVQNRECIMVTLNLIKIKSILNENNLLFIILKVLLNFCLS